MAGIPTFIKKTLYPTCKLASSCRFTITKGSNFGLFVVTSPSTAIGVDTNTEHIVLPRESIHQVEQFTQAIEHQQQNQQEQLIIIPNSELEHCMIQRIKLIAEQISDTPLSVNIQQDEFQVGKSSTPLSPSRLPTTNNSIVEVEGVEEFTVSFGDMNSYPFCTCTYWQQYKLPCIHMFAIFQDISGWSYDMLSPAYRMNNMFCVDSSCISHCYSSNSQLSKDNSCQTNSALPTMVTVQTQKNVGVGSLFIPMNTMKVNEDLYRQVTDLLFQLNKSSFLFKDVVMYKRIRGQLTDIVKNVHQRLTEKQFEKTIVDKRIPSIAEALPKLLPQKSMLDVVNPIATPYNEIATDVTTGKTKMDNISSEKKKKFKVKVALEPHTAPASHMHLVNSINVDEINKLLAALSQAATQQDITTSSNSAIVVNSNNQTQSVELSANVDNETDTGTSSARNITLKPVTQNKQTATKSSGGSRITFPVLQTGLKRDACYISSNSTTDSLNDKNNQQYNKVSILEYLPLLKRKCVNPRGEQINKQKINTDNLLTEKLNLTPVSTTVGNTNTSITTSTGEEILDTDSLQLPLQLLI